MYSHHAWVSATGFSEAYNEAVRSHDKWKAGCEAEQKTNVKVSNWRLRQAELTVARKGMYMYMYILYSGKVWQG